MATTDNNLHIPDDLLAQAEKLAASEGRTADDLAADALKRYLAQRVVEQNRAGGPGAQAAAWAEIR